MSGAFLYDQLREIPKGADPRLLVEWSEIIERRAIECRGDSVQRPIRFKGTVNEQMRFGLEVDAPDPDGMVCLHEAIQSCLTLMPVITREFFGAIMVSLVSEAEEKEGTSDTAKDA
jgi:hypothetical protein